MAKPKNSEYKPDLYPDAWQRFERFIRDIAKAGPQHRIGKTSRKAGAAKRKTKPNKERR